MTAAYGADPVDPAGSSRYVWAVGAFALGFIYIAGRIPAYTCDRGHFNDVLTVGMHPIDIGRHELDAP